VPTICTTQARAARMRLTRLDECGVPVEGACSTLVTSGFVSVGVEPIYRDADEIEVVNANAELCIKARTCPQLKWDELEIVMCLVDPDAWNIITGDAVVLDDAGTPNTVGFRQSGADLCTANFALELWTNITDTACTDPTMKPWGYWLFPFVGQGTVGEFTFENEGLTLTMSAITQEGSGWGVGPYNVRRDVTLGTPEPLLTAIGADDHMHFERVTLAPPAAVCGCQALTIP
jgi:hypothetical protein